MIEILKDIRSGALPFREIPIFIWHLIIDKRKKINERLEKYYWKDEWIDKFIPSSSYLGIDNITEAFVFTFFGVFILALLMVLYSYFTFYKDQLLNILAKMMVEQSLKNGASFSQIYFSFGAAIIIGISFFILGIFAWRILFRKEDKSIPDISHGLAEIAYMLEHKSAASIIKNSEGKK